MASTGDDDWTHVGKKRENKSAGQSKPKKHEGNGKKTNNHPSTQQHRGRPAKGNKSNATPVKSKPEPQIMKAPSVDSSMILASKSDDEVITKEPAVPPSNPWTNTPKFSETMSVSQGIKDLQINDLNVHSIKPEEFARICRSFDVKSTNLAKFYTRGLMNTGYACFRNCILQALLSVTPFMSLITIILETLDQQTIPSPPFTVWREVVAVYREFTQSSNSNRQSNSSSNKPNKGGNSISANLFMSSLFASFNESVAGRQPNRRVDTSKPFFSQEDAMEFLTYLLDALHEEIVQFEAAVGANGATDATSAVAAESNGSDSNTTTEEAAGASRDENDSNSSSWNTVTTKKPVKSVVDDKSKDIVAKASEASVISKLFHCTLRSKVHYRQKKLDSITFQRLFCVTLDVRSTAFSNKLTAASESKVVGKSVSVEQCLDLFFEEESIDDGEIKKQLKFDTLPEILVLQLSRFFFDYYKNVSVKVMQEVTYPVELQLTERHMSEELVQRLSSTNNRTSSSSNGFSEATYSLSSVVLHHGENATKGHYSTLSRDPNNPTMWRALNDTKVSSIKEDQATSAKSLAYLLFYTRKNSSNSSNSCSGESEMN